MPVDRETREICARDQGGRLRVIDLSGDFRLPTVAAYQSAYGTTHPAPQLLDQFVYGLPELKRDEIARVTNGYSPAMIEQVTSMALTIAHHSGRERFSWDDLVESITTLESGTAIGIEYIEREGLATAIHEAGHAIAGHAFMKDFESTRLSIRRRGDSGGHHQAREKEERFGYFQSELFAQLVWGLGAMAAERVVYGENTNGVGGDVMSVTAQTAGMVGGAAMGPLPFVATPRDGEAEEEAPSGKPAAAASSAMRNSDRHASSAGFTTHALPAARAPATLRPKICIG